MTINKSPSKKEPYTKRHADRKKNNATTNRRRHDNIRTAIYSTSTTKAKTTSKPLTQSKKGSRSRKVHPQRRKRAHQSQKHTVKKKIQIPPLAKDSIRIIPLGGVEEIGKNMTVIEYQDDIIIVDAGFQFSEAETPGIDFILPNVSYLEEHKEKIRALFITHGHYDHIGAIPYLMERIGNPPIYSREFGAIIIQKRQMEFPHMPEPDIHIVRGDRNEIIRAGTHFKVSSFPISHAIPDSMGLLIDTPHGTIAFIEDVRVDHKNGVPTKAEVEHYKRFKDKKILLLTLDSTSIEKPGFSLPESEAVAGIEEVMKNVAGRLIIGTFASQVERVMQMISMANKYNKKVVVDGRSMKSNVDIIKQLKLIKMENVIPIEEMEKHPPHKIVVIATGAQGEEYSVFDRIANKTHRYIRLNTTDTVLFSASIIPGNERSITKLKDNLYRQEAKVITYLDSNVHASGHGSRGELEWIHKQINYKYFMPVHGHHFMLRIHAEVAQSLGTAKEHTIIPDNGSIIEIQNGGKKLVKLREQVPADSVMVDGFSIGNMQEAVIRDRQLLSEDGMFIVVVSINPKTGKLRKSPDIISRGFVYLRESQELLKETRNLIKKTVEDTTKGMHPINFDYVKNAVTDSVRRHLFQKTAKSPIVIPVVIGV